MGLFEQGAGWLKKTFSSNPPESKKPPPREWSKHKQEVLEKRFEKNPRLKPLQFENAEHPMVLKYQPQPEGVGGETFVFEVPDSPNVVVKADKHAMLNIAAWNADHGFPADADSEKAQEYRDEKLREERERYRQLKLYFGAEHVLPQKKYFMKVPINQGMIEDIALLAGEGMNTVPDFSAKEAWTMVTVQRRAKELKNPSHLDVRGVNLEMRHRFDLNTNQAAQANYRRVTEPLLSEETAAKSELDPDDFREVIDHPAIDKLLVMAGKDEDLRDVLKDFCERAAQYANITGEIVDFSGKDNVIFFKKPDGRWSYQLVDALYGYMPQALKEGREAYFRGQIKSSTNREATALFQSVNFTRIINGIGKLVGAKEFVDFLPSKREGQEDVLKLLIPAAEMPKKKIVDMSVAEEATMKAPPQSL